MTPVKRIVVSENLLAENDRIAGENRALLARRGILSLNLMGSPGSGKTALLERTIPLLRKRYPVGVIEGDIAGILDSRRLNRFRVPIVQVNTGGGCHLDASMIARALRHLPLERLRILFVENVGNLVCPAEFDLGFGKNVIVASVPEGDEKPAKYPLVFRVSDVCLLNKADLLRRAPFDERAFRRRAARAHPGMPVIPVSARTGRNFRQWMAYLENLLEP